MKKSLIGAMMAGALFVGASQAFAADGTPAVEKAPQVFVDGSEMRFDVDPKIVDGTTLVQFRTIFEKLGLEVGWDGDTQTVTGTKAGLSLKLVIGSKTVWVNGQEKELEVAPRIENGSTLVPLRFVGESSGREVSWDGRNKEIYIANTEDQLRHLLDKQLAFIQAEDLDGVQSTLDPNSPVYDQNKLVLGQLFAAYDLSNKLETFEVLAVQGDNAQIETTVTTSKVKGPDFEDNSSSVVHQLRKVDGEWKFTQSIPQKTTFLKPDVLKETPVTLSADEQKKVLDVVEQDRKLSEQEDLKAEKTLYASTYPNLDQMFRLAGQLTAVYDFKVTYDDVKLIQGSENMAKVKVTATISKTRGPDFRNMRMVSVYILNKNKEGQWKFMKNDQVSIEYLQ